MKFIHIHSYYKDGHTRKVVVQCSYHSDFIQLMVDNSCTSFTLYELLHRGVPDYYLAILCGAKLLFKWATARSVPSYQSYPQNTALLPLKISLRLPLKAFPNFLISSFHFPLTGACTQSLAYFTIPSFPFAKTVLDPFHQFSSISSHTLGVHTTFSFSHAF